MMVPQKKVNILQEIIDELPDGVYKISNLPDIISECQLDVVSESGLGTTVVVERTPKFRPNCVPLRTTYRMTRISEDSVSVEGTTSTMRMF